MNGTACNLEQIIELEYDDLFTLEDALNHVLFCHLACF